MVAKACIGQQSCTVDVAAANLPTNFSAAKCGSPNDYRLGIIIKNCGPPPVPAADFVFDFGQVSPPRFVPPGDDCSQLC